MELKDVPKPKFVVGELCIVQYNNVRDEYIVAKVERVKFTNGKWLYKLSEKETHFYYDWFGENDLMKIRS